MNPCPRAENNEAEMSASVSGKPSVPVRGFYINLDRSEERRLHIESEVRKLAPLGTYRRYAAVEGRSVEGWPHAGNRAELGCYLSHLGVIRENSGYDGWLHVVEDDVVISKHTAGVIAAVLEKPDVAQYDIVFQSVTIKNDLFSVQRFRRMYDKNVEVLASGEPVRLKNVAVMPIGMFEFFGCASYLIRPESIGRVAEILERELKSDPFAPVDRVISTAAGSGELTAACTAPFLVVPRLKPDSTIQESADLWRMSQILVKHVLYADRDVRRIRQIMSALEGNFPKSVTSELIAGAYRNMIVGNLGMADSRSEKPNPQN
jgi:GR25 family glycosyltransferase involved in LPS biosynthesis